MELTSLSRKTTISSEPTLIMEIEHTKAAFRDTPHIQRYDIVTKEKSGGAVYTPKILSDFVSQQIVVAARELSIGNSLRILDPAVGHGDLLVSLLEHLPCQRNADVEVCGFETDPEALDIAKERIEQQFPDVSVRFESENFLEHVIERFGPMDKDSLFRPVATEAFDFVIANPPYVRTQIMGSHQAQILSEQFGLSGRVDLYHAFILGIAHILKPQGIAGIIVSNRFMTTKSGATVRQVFFDRFNIRHAWDLGDTKLFEAAVLPAVVLVHGKNSNDRGSPAFTSIYETSELAIASATDPIAALSEVGVVKVDDGRHFRVQHGKIDTNGKPNGVWRIATKYSDTWLKTVASRSWGTFRDIGKVRVGVKTCADRIFIRDDWQSMAEANRPELLKPLMTHHVARRFRCHAPTQPRHILYPHEIVGGRRRPVDLSYYPRSEAYLSIHRRALEGRKYVIEAGRKWYEIWVPQDPRAWDRPKLVFRDIAEHPTFWIDLDGSVVNGDCYWLVAEDPADADLLWLAVAIANSTFIERFYDLRFHNKLYAGRRRFMTQYVENFPLPDPRSSLGTSIIAKAKRMHKGIPSRYTEFLQQELDAMVWRAFTGDAITG